MNFHTERERHLVAFLQDTYGEMLSLFLLTGLDEQGWSGLRYFTVCEVDQDEKVIRHRLAMISDDDTSLPHGRDPLVLAALLKLLLERSKTYRMKCSLVDLMAILGWEDLASARQAVAGAMERYYTASLALLAPSEDEPYFGESPTFALKRRILIDQETRGAESERGTKAYFNIAFNPDCTTWLMQRILLDIDWKRVVAIEV